jgi:hypothetical protein
MKNLNHRRRARYPPRVKSSHGSHPFVHPLRCGADWYALKIPYEFGAAFVGRWSPGRKAHRPNRFRPVSPLARCRWCGVVCWHPVATCAPARGPIAPNETGSEVVRPACGDWDTHHSLRAPDRKRAARAGRTSTETPGREVLARGGEARANDQTPTADPALHASRSDPGERCMALAASTEPPSPRLLARYGRAGSQPMMA